MVKVKKNISDKQDIRSIIQPADTHAFFQHTQALRFYSLDPLQKNDSSDVFKAVDDDLLSEETETIFVNGEGMTVEVPSQEIRGTSEITTDADDDGSEYIVIGCRAPNGLVIRAKGQTVLLRGIADMPGHEGIRSYGGVGFTRISKSLWDEFMKKHPQWLPVMNGTVFVSNNQDLWWEE